MYNAISLGLFLTSARCKKPLRLNNRENAGLSRASVDYLIFISQESSEQWTISFIHGVPPAVGLLRILQINCACAGGNASYLRQGTVSSLHLEPAPSLLPRLGYPAQVMHSAHPEYRFSGDLIGGRRKRS